MNIDELSGAREVLSDYERLLRVTPELCEKVSSMRRDADASAVALEERFRGLQEGYTRLNRLALEAPLGLSTAASQYSTRLLDAAGGPANSMAAALSGWDSERHREVLYDAKEAHRALEQSADKKCFGGAKGLRRSLQQQQQRRSNNKTAKPSSESEHYSVSLRRYTGGFHGQPEEKKEEKKEEVVVVKKKKKFAKPTRSSVLRREQTSPAPETKLLALRSINEAVGVATRAAKAAELAAQLAARHASQPPQPSPVRYRAPRRWSEEQEEEQEEQPQYRILPVTTTSRRRPAVEESFTLAEPPEEQQDDDDEEEVEEEEEAFPSRKAVTVDVERKPGPLSAWTKHNEIFMAAPTVLSDYSDSPPHSSRRPPAQATPAGYSRQAPANILSRRPLDDHPLERERRLAVAHAKPLFLFQAQKPAAPPAHVASRRAASEIGGYARLLFKRDSGGTPRFVVEGEDEEEEAADGAVDGDPTLRLVARMMLAENDDREQDDEQDDLSRCCWPPPPPPPPPPKADDDDALRMMERNARVAPSSSTNKAAEEAPPPPPPLVRPRSRGDSAAASSAALDRARAELADQRALYRSQLEQLRLEAALDDGSTSNYFVGDEITAFTPTSHSAPSLLPAAPDESTAQPTAQPTAHLVKDDEIADQILTQPTFAPPPLFPADEVEEDVLLGTLRLDDPPPEQEEEEEQEEDVLLGTLLLDDPPPRPPPPEHDDEEQEEEDDSSYIPDAALQQQATPLFPGASLDFPGGSLNSSFSPTSSEYPTI